MWPKPLESVGPEYQQGYVALVTCALAQLVVTLTGPVGTMLTMCGHEKNTVKYY